MTGKFIVIDLQKYNVNSMMSLGIGFGFWELIKNVVYLTSDHGEVLNNAFKILP